MSRYSNQPNFGSMGAIPKSNDAYKILQDDKYNEMGLIEWTAGETWGVLMYGSVFGVAMVLLFNRYYR